MADEAAERSTAQVSIGPELGRLLDVARGARLSVLLVGGHGIGKSEFLEGYALERGLDAYILDLSLLEATDLTGIPYVRDGVTRFAPPATLPPTDGGPCLLVLEELNRCDRSVRQPCLQLLTARRLNEYRLPDDCLVAACINPSEGEYDVEELDPALASRFVTVSVEADRDAWLAWARRSDVPKELVQFVDNHPQVFDATPPRSWTLAGRLARVAIDLGWGFEEVERGLRTLLPPVGARAYAVELRGLIDRLPTPEDLVLDAEKHTTTMRTLVADGRLDAVDAMLRKLGHFLSTADGEAVLADGELREPLLGLVRQAPPDLRSSVEQRLVR
jgi:hypothetical protein